MDPQDAWPDMPDMPDRGRGPGPLAVTAVLIVSAIVAWAIAYAIVGPIDEQCLTEDVYGCMTAGNYVNLFLPIGIMGLGGIGVFVKAYLEARKGRPWGGWHGAGWVLLIMMLVFSSIAMGQMMT